MSLGAADLITEPCIRWGPDPNPSRKGAILGGAVPDNYIRSKSKDGLFLSFVAMLHGLAAMHRTSQCYHLHTPREKSAPSAAMRPAPKLSRAVIFY